MDFIWFCDFFLIVIISQYSNYVSMFDIVTSIRTGKI